MCTFYRAPLQHATPGYGVYFIRVTVGREGDGVAGLESVGSAFFGPSDLDPHFTKLLDPDQQ